MSAPYGDVAVIGFDLDLTLYPKTAKGDELIQGYLHERIAEHLHVPVTEAKALFDGLYRSAPGMSGRMTLETLGVPGAADLVQEAIERADVAAMLVGDEETALLLRDLAEKYGGIDLVTGSSLIQARKKLAAIGIPEDVFRHWITHEDGSKSDGTAFRLWQELFPAITPGRFLYVGDNASTDYSIARQFGIRTILVNCAEADDRVACPQLPTLAEIRPLLL